VFDAHVGKLKVDAMRTNTGAAYSLIDADLVMQLIRARIARATAVAFEALVFDNVDAAGAGDMNTLHAGQPVTRGEKWLLSQWIRDKPQPVA